jgi:hypothetical protein
MGFWLRWGGVLLGAISLFSFVQKLRDFGLAPIFNDVLNFYRTVLYPIADALAGGMRWVLSLIDITLPSVPPDLIIIYALIGSAAFRSALNYHEPHERFPLPLLILGCLFWPVTIFVAPVLSKIFYRIPNWYDRGEIILWAKEIAKAVVGFFTHLTAVSQRAEAEQTGKGCVLV